MREIARFTEPVKGYELTLWELSLNEIDLSPYQRQVSTLLKNRLATHSISYGFFSPVLVVRKGDRFILVDGQHRIEALSMISRSTTVLALEIPKHMKHYPLIYNIEMSDKIKDICAKIYALYVDHSQQTPDADEKSLAPFLDYSPYYATLAFAHVEFELSSPSLVETAIKKFDDWIDGALQYTLQERRLRGQKVAELEQVVNEVAATAGISGSGAFQLKSAIVSKTNVAIWGKKRSVDEDFNSAISIMIEHIYSRDWSFLAS